MSDLLYSWDPNEWELHVQGLLNDRHGATNVQKVPARHKGDHGLDYYCLGARVAYQCYAVQEPCGVEDRATKQKAKITADIRKFCTNKKKLSKIFSSTTLTRWILVVPVHDSSEVNPHLTAKSQEVRDLALPYADSTFEVLIQDHNNFEPESRRNRLMMRRVLELSSMPASPDDLRNWTQGSQDLVDTLTRKLRKRVGVEDSASLDRAVATAVGMYLERENTLERLRIDLPELHEVIASVITRRATRLILFGPPSNGSPNDILRREVDELIGELSKEIPNVSLASAEKIAMGTIADWLIRCPLDFPSSSHAS